MLTPAEGDCSCCHLDALCVERAAAAVQLTSLTHPTHDMVCAECGLSGSFNDVQFRMHFLMEQHYVYVRVRQPIELYCCHCGDYQYSDYFDQLVGRKRVRRTLSTLESLRTKRILIDRPQPRAIVNMGATCFMGSVLQVMLNNSVILFSKQMQQSKSGLEPCSKGKEEMKNVKNCGSSSESGSVKSVTVFSLLATNKEGTEGTEAGSDITSISPSCITYGCIACEFKKLFWESIDTTTEPRGKGVISSIIPSNLLFSVWSHADYMAGYDQQDAHEFLIALLDGLGSHLEKYHGEANTSFPRYPSPYEPNGNSGGYSRSNSITDAPSLSRNPSQGSLLPLSNNNNNNVNSNNGSSNGINGNNGPNNGVKSSPRYNGESPRFQNQGPWSPRNTPNKSSCFRGFVNEVFAGWMQSELHCMHCGHCSYKLEPFLDVSLSLEISLPNTESNSLNCDAMNGENKVINEKNGESNTDINGVKEEVQMMKSDLEEGIEEVKYVSDGISDHDDSSAMGINGEESPIPTPHTPHTPTPVPTLQIPTPPNPDSPSTATPTPTSSPSPVPSHTPSPVPSHTPSPVPSPVPTPTPTPTRTPSVSPMKPVRTVRPVKDDSITLSQCLQHFTSLETLSEQVKCDACKQHRPSKKRLSLSSAPKVLILHFKRFDSLRQLKICSKVHFPLRGFNLAPFMQQQYHRTHDNNHNNHDNHSRSSSFSSSSSGNPIDISGNHGLGSAQNTNQGPGSTQKELLYDLQGLVNHKGSLTQGHYVAYVAAMKDESCSSETTSWLRCDDETVTAVSEEDVLNAEGYILFYVSRNNIYG